MPYPISIRRREFLRYASGKTIFPARPTFRSRICEAAGFLTAPSWLLDFGMERIIRMAKIKLTKIAVDEAMPRAKEFEVRDTIVPGLLVKVTPAGRKIFMVQYRTNAGVRRKPAIGRFDRHIVPRFGSAKVREVTRVNVSDLITRMKNTPVTANRVLSCVRKIFDLAEVWSFRDDGTNPCRHIPKYAESGQTWLITNEEMARLFQYLHRADLEGLEHPFLTLAIRLQFAFAARMSEVIGLEWR
jgi:hypothetical protein